MGKQQRSEGGGLSLRTKDATAGGGTEGARAVIEEIGNVDEFTYGGRQKDDPQAALRVVYRIEGFSKPWEDHYTYGKSAKYEVIEDGYGIRSTGKKQGLNENSKAYLFFASVEAAAEESGLDIDELLPEIDGGGNSVQPLEGRAVILTNKKFKTVGGDLKDTVVVASFVDDDEKPTRANSKGGGTPVKGKGKGPSVEEQAEAAVTALIEEKTSVKKGDLANLVYQADRKNPDIKAIMNLCFKDAWVASEDRPWSFDKKKGVLRAAD